LVSDPHLDWQKISVCEAFACYADIDLELVLEDIAAFEVAAGRAGCPPHDGDSWDDLFFRVFLEKIEPNLGYPVPTILYDYPKCMASLARIKQSDPRFAERFEVYVCGLELANAFGELNNATEQRKRFEEAMAEKQKTYGDTWPVDGEFLKALEHGLPACSGIALGVDRLAILVTGADHIDLVQALKVI
jgi:lysyl-tRNA synthetase class 2